jgi:hypothetical protein
VSTMVRLLKQFLIGEKGQALIIVLGLLALGGVTIAMSLNHTTTSLKGSGIVEEKTEGVYAAGAGIEYALWAIANSEEVPTQLSENISGMAVGIETENEGVWTLYLGELIETQPPQINVDWVEVSGNITDLGGGVYRYTITVTWQPGAPTTFKVVEVGARLPVGYGYQVGSANIGGNLSTSEPTSNQVDPYGAYLPVWEFSPPLPDISENETGIQLFNITGTGSTDGHYAVVTGQPESIGPVGQIKGGRYKITATATRPEDGRTTAEIVADLMIRDDGVISITSWKITK